MLEGKNFVIQFEDGQFLKPGVFHGFVEKDGEFFVGKTKKLKEAVIFGSEHQAPRIAHDLSITEPYEVKEIEIVYKLK